MKDAPPLSALLCISHSCVDFCGGGNSGWVGLQLYSAAERETIPFTETQSDTGRIAPNLRGSRVRSYLMDEKTPTKAERRFLKNFIAVLMVRLSHEDLRQESELLI